MGLGTRKPETREKNPNFLVPEPDLNLRNGTQTWLKPKTRNLAENPIFFGTQSRPDLNRTRLLLPKPITNTEM